MNTTVSWGKLKPLDEYKTGLFPHNRWGMVYQKKHHEGWKCLACTCTFQEADGGERSARGHYCLLETTWREFSGRQAPELKPVILQLDYKPIEKVIVPSEKKPLINRLFSWFGGLLS